jgi:hypothetical protein
MPKGAPVEVKKLRLVDREGGFIADTDLSESGIVRIAGSWLKFGLEIEDYVVEHLAEESERKHSNRRGTGINQFS